MQKKLKKHKRSHKKHKERYNNQILEKVRKKFLLGKMKLVTYNQTMK